MKNIPECGKGAGFSDEIETDHARVRVFREMLW